MKTNGLPEWYYFNDGRIGFNRHFSKAETLYKKLFI